MPRERYIRSNVRVVYDDPKKSYAQAYLQFKVNVWLVFHKWVNVNSSYYTDCWGKSLTPDQIFNNLKKEGQEYKSVKLRQRNFDKAI
jgi:hypothetical protein